MAQLTRAMQATDYRKIIAVSASPEVVFRAITEEMALWWSVGVSGSLDTVGARAKATFPPGVSFWTFEAVALEQDRYIEARCVEALHIHEGQPAEIEQEWLDTKLRWWIEPVADGAKITFEHQGLSPKLLCYDICQQGWDFFFEQSLAAFLNTGEGMPHKGSA